MGPCAHLMPHTSRAASHISMLSTRSKRLLRSLCAASTPFLPGKNFFNGFSPAQFLSTMSLEGYGRRAPLVQQMPLRQRTFSGGKINVKIFSGTANPELAREVADYLEIGLGQLKIAPFSDGEIYVQIQESVRGVD